MNAQHTTSIPRVAIVGAGHVGSTTAYALLISGVAAEIVLVDRDRKRAEAHVEDLRDAVIFSHTTHLFAGDLSDCRTADITIVTASAPQASTRSRLDHLHDSAVILRQILDGIGALNPTGILLIASNPVDVLTYAAYRWSELPPGRVIGSGTSLDTSRFRRRLGALYGVSPETVHAYIIGEHGDSQVPILSSAQIAGMSVENLCREHGLPYDADVLRSIANETRTAGYEIVSGKGASYFGIGAALARIVNAVLRDERGVFCVSSRVPDALGLGDVALSLPSLIGREGILRVMPIQANAAEREALEASAALLKEHIATLDRPQALHVVTTASA
jgi:L-lactate dehydrogenase